MPPAPPPRSAAARRSRLVRSWGVLGSRSRMLLDLRAKDRPDVVLGEHTPRDVGGADTGRRAGDVLGALHQGGGASTAPALSRAVRAERSAATVTESRALSAAVRSPRRRVLIPGTLIVRKPDHWCLPGGHSTPRVRSHPVFRGSTPRPDAAERRGRPRPRTGIRACDPRTSGERRRTPRHPECEGGFALDQRQPWCPRNDQQRRGLEGEGRRHPGPPSSSPPSPNIWPSRTMAALSSSPREGM